MTIEERIKALETAIALQDQTMHKAALVIEVLTDKALKKEEEIEEMKGVIDQQTDVITDLDKRVSDTRDYMKACMMQIFPG